MQRSANGAFLTNLRVSSYSLTSMVSYSSSRLFSLRQSSVSLNCLRASGGENLRALK